MSAVVYPAAGSGAQHLPVGKTSGSVASSSLGAGQHPLPLPLLRP